MKDYKFKLEKVLEYRKDKENLAKQELANQQKKLKKAEERLSYLQYEYKEMAYYRGNEPGKELDLEGLKILNDYLSYLDLEIKGQRKVVYKLAEEVKNQQNNVKNAMQDRKTLETLKEKGYQDFLEEVKTQEKNLIDELGLRSYLDSEGSSWNLSLSSK